MKRKQICEEKGVSNFTAIQTISTVNENKIIIYQIPSKRKFDGPSSRLKYEEKVLQLGVSQPFAYLSLEILTHTNFKKFSTFLAISLLDYPWILPNQELIFLKRVLNPIQL